MMERERHLNPGELEKRAETVFAERDGEWTYLIERICVFGTILVLMVSAPFAAIVPDNWLQLDVLVGIDRWGREAWPKLYHDAGVLDGTSVVRGVRYALFVLYCVGVAIAVLSVTIPITWQAISRSSERLTYPQSRSLWKVPLGLLLLLLWNGFETGLLFGSDTSVSRAIIGGYGLWLWTALTWGVF